MSTFFEVLMYVASGAVLVSTIVALSITLGMAIERTSQKCRFASVGPLDDGMDEDINQIFENFKKLSKSLYRREQMLYTIQRASFQVNGQWEGEGWFIPIEAIRDAEVSFGASVSVEDFLNKANLV